jgi:hypothetical protein
MKGFLTLILVFCVSIFMTAQVPQQINYQAVARDATSGAPIANQTVKIQFVIRDSASTGAVEYREQYDTVHTNSLGLFVAPIGGGTPLYGSFSHINWATGLNIFRFCFQLRVRVYSRIWARLSF